ncbi:MAG: FAD:protein FMN transferase [Clostridia bacterium]|nr:FAD:protein FMN transferase [Clostridia bacterium]
MQKQILRRWAAAACALLFLLPLCGCGAGKRLYSRSTFDCFDTVCTVSAYTGSPEEFDRLYALALETMTADHRRFDIYHEYEGMNNLCTVNLRAGEAPVKVERELLDFLSSALQLCAATEGSVNIAFGSVLSLWHTYRTAANAQPDAAALPPQSELQAAAAHCDPDDVVLDFENETVFLRDGEMSLDVGAYAKGYAEEHTAKVLIANGYTNFALDFGGNIRTVGTKGDGSAWVCGVAQPQALGADGYAAKLATADAAVATSGNDLRTFTVDGVQYGHIISPEDLMPARRYLSVSVIAPDAGAADLLSTACFILPYADGQKLISSIPYAEAMWILPEGEILCTDGFSEYRAP